MYCNVYGSLIERIYLDLDEVLVDFIGGAYSLLTGKNNTPTTKEYIDFIDKFDNDLEYGTWGRDKIRLAGSKWWRTLKKLPWADELLDASKCCGDVFLLTNPGIFSEAAQGKWEWASDNGFTGKIILASDKTCCASPSSVLIDDMKKNINPWIESGGIGLKLKREWSDKGISPKDIIGILNSAKNCLKISQK